MKNPLTKREQKGVATFSEDPFLEACKQLAQMDIDADKFDKFLRMQERILDRNAKGEFFAAMNRVQAALPTVTKDATNPQTNSQYSRLETIAKAIKPVYTAEGFSATFSEGKTDKEGYIRIDGILRHSAGHSEPGHVDLPRDDSGIKGNVNKTPLHASGSTFTYGRRYLTCMMFDVATGDDTDGNLPVQTLSTDQQTVINDLLKETNSNKEKFLKYACADTVEGISIAHYAHILKTLKAKRGDA